MKYSKNQRAEKSMDASVKESVFGTASNDMVWDYVAPYAIYLGASNREIGLISLMQNIGNAVSKIPGARIVSIWSRKTIWYISYFLSRILWLFVLLLAFLPAYEIAILMALVFAIAFINGIRYPAWSSLMGDIVPAEKRGVFFGKRNMLSGIASIAATLAAGLIVVVYGFGFLFLLSIAVGMASVYYFSRIYEPPVKTDFHYKHSINLEIRQWAVSMRINPNFMWFTLYMIMVSFAIALASPFYPVAMLKNIGIGYIWYAVLITLETLIVILSQPYWGRLCDRLDDRLMLLLLSTLICFIPFFWMFANNLWLLVFVHVFDGFVFGGWTLATFNFLLATTPPQKRASLIANHSFFAGMATVCGMLAGSVLVDRIELAGIGGLAALFFLSFLLRIAAVALLLKVKAVHAKREIEPLAFLALRVMIIDPVKSASKAVGYVYDIRWVVIKIRHGTSQIIKKLSLSLRRIVWKFRLYKADKS